MARSSSQKINKETEDLNNIVGQMDLIDILRAFHLKAVNLHTFQVHMGCSLAHFQVHMLEHKISLNKFKKTEIMSSIFAEYKGFKN